MATGVHIAEKDSQDTDTMGSWSNATYVNHGDLDTVEKAITDLFADESWYSTPRPPVRTEMIYPPMQYHRAVENDLWAIALIPGRAGWTTIRTAPFDLFCERAEGAARIRLASLAMALDCNALTYNLYDTSNGMLLEALPTGQYTLAGFIQNPDYELPTMDYYDEPYPGDENCQEYFRLLEPRKIVSPEASEESRRALLALAESPYPEYRSYPDHEQITAALADALGGPNAQGAANSVLVHVLIPNKDLNVPGGRTLYFRRPRTMTERGDGNMAEWSSCTYVNHGDLDSVEHAITELFAREGMYRAKRRRKFPRTKRGLLQYHRAADNNQWSVALLPGREGWTIIQTVPFDLFCERPTDEKRIRLAALTEKLDCHALTYNMYNKHRGMMIEATPTGEYALSGFIENPAPDGLMMDYYDEPNGGGSSAQTHFQLLEASEIARQASSKGNKRLIEGLDENPYLYPRESPAPEEITRAVADALGGSNAEGGSTHTLLDIMIPNQKLERPGGRIVQYRRE